MDCLTTPTITGQGGGGRPKSASEGPPSIAVREASYKRSFTGESHISSDCVLKLAMQHPRTQS